MKIPNNVITVVSETLGYHLTHDAMNSLFLEHGALPPPPGNKVLKCSRWLKLVNESKTIDPLVFLGKILEDYMDYEIAENNFNIYEWGQNRDRIRTALGRHQLEYRFGGFIVDTNADLPTRGFQEIFRARDLPAVEAEFGRALTSIDGDPPAGLTAACSLLEALFKTLIEDDHLDMPSSETVKPLWNTVGKHLGFDPAAMPDDDLKRILSGLTSVVDGLGSLRTHAGSAHGRGHRSYRVKPRHARLALNAAHTLAAFILETWDDRKRQVHESPEP
jgi:hypothetical protein